MNRFAKTALAIVAAGSAANAGTGTDGNEWLELDSAINGLSSSLQPSQDGMSWSALIRAVYSYSSDEIAIGPGANAPDVSGLNFNDVDMAFWGNQGPYAWRVSADISNNEGGDNSTAFLLEDAYVKWNCGGYFDAMMGNFKPHASRSNSVDPEKMLFIDRSSIGSALDAWDNGIGLRGTWEQAAWYVCMMNGSLANPGGGHTRDHLWMARGEWNLGTGVGDSDGAVGSNDMLNATVGVTFINDDSLGTTGGNSDQDLWLADFHGNINNVGFGFEVAAINDDISLATDEDFSNTFAPLVLSDDSTPWNVSVSYLINPEWEVGVRYEDLDNNDFGGVSNAGEDNTLMTVVANWYRNGNAGKWQAQWTDVDGDTLDGSIFEFGYSIGSSR
jgi:hypothetical protein